MARIRTIKPEFFLHEKLAELQPLTRLLFIGLWTLADRNGRLEDRPKRIKAEVLPYDDAADVNEMLWHLHKYDFIVRYEVEGKGFIEICSFIKHQHCNLKEPDGTIPAPEQQKKDEMPARESTGNNNENNHSARESTCEKDNNNHSARESTCRHVPTREGTCGKGKGKGTGMEVVGCARAREDAPTTPPPPPPPPKSFDISALKPSEEERIAWEVLCAIPDYPKSAESFEHLRGLIGEFQDLNPVKVLRSWRDYLISAKNGKAKASLSALRTQFMTAAADTRLSKVFSRSAGGKAAQKAEAAGKPFEPDENPPAAMKFDAGAKDAFDRAIAEMRQKVDQNSFSAWIEPLEFLGVHCNEIVFGVGCSLQANWIRSNYEDELIPLLGRPIRYVLVEKG